MNRTEHATGWGSLAPSGLGAALLWARKAGAVHGAMKKLMARVWAGLGLTTPVDIVYEGLKFRVHPWDNTVEYKMLFGSKPRDRAEIRQLRSYVADGGVFVDIGANIGYYALMAACHGARRVLAFEPNPKVFDRLAFNVAANDLQDRITTFALALGDRDDSVTLSIFERDMGGSSIGQTGGTSGTSVVVDMRPLASVLAEQGIERVAALKIDVEGMEDRVLKPFFETSPRQLWPRLVIIEHTSRQAWRDDILSWMLASGYKEVARNRSNAMLCLS